MSTTTADPVLNMIARKTMHIQWQHPLDQGELDTCTELQNNPNTPRRLVTLLRDYKTWVVRTCLAGGQRTFGFFKPDQYGRLAAAYRYADMVKMRFWPYKLRDAYKPSDGELNISAERAENDLVNEIEAVAILDEIEAHFKQVGIILTPQDKETQLQARIRQQRARPTVKTVLNDVAGVFQMRCDKLEAENKSMRSVVFETRDMVVETRDMVVELRDVVKEQAATIIRVNSFLSALLNAAQSREPVPTIAAPVVTYETTTTIGGAA